MKGTGGQQARWRCRISVLLLFLAAVRASQHLTYHHKTRISSSVIFGQQRGGGHSSLLIFAEAGSVIKTFKRMVNLGWRNGGRWMCEVLGCDYEHVKNQLYNQPSVFVSYKALCTQMDRLEMEISTQLGGQPTAAQRELRYILLSKAVRLLQQHLGLTYDIPSQFLPPSLEINAQVGKGQPVSQGGQATADTGASEEGAASGARTEDMRQRLSALRNTVQLPTEDEFDRNARQRLAELQKQHTTQALKLKAMSRQKLQLLTEAHERESARLFNELQQTQTAELSVVRGELEKQKQTFLQALESFSVTGKLLGQSMTYMQRLYEAVHRMAAHFNRLINVETKLAQLQKALQEDASPTFLYSCLQAVSQSDVAVAQVVKQVLSVYEETSSTVNQLQNVLNDAESAVETPAIDAAHLTAQKQVFRERLNQFRSAAYTLIARMEETVQTAEERKLVTLFISEDVRNKVLSTIRDRVTQWKDQLTHLQERTDLVDSSHTQFLRLGASLGRRVLAAVNRVLQSPADDSLAGVSEEIAELEKQGNKIREELSRIIESLPVLEQEIKRMSEGLRIANIPASTLEELGVPFLLSALRSQHDLKERAQKMFLAIRSGLGRTEKTLRILQALQTEAHLLRSPAEREALDNEIRDLMNKLRDVRHHKAEVEVDLQHLHVDINQLQNSIQQIGQRLSLERRSAHLAGDIRGWMGTAGEQDVGSEKAANAVTELEEELKTTAENLANKQQQLAAKHTEKMRLIGEAEKLEGEVKSRQHIVAEEQDRVARITELSQAVMGNLQSEEMTRSNSQSPNPQA